MHRRKGSRFYLRFLKCIFCFLFKMNVSLLPGYCHRVLFCLLLLLRFYGWIPFILAGCSLLSVLQMSFHHNLLPFLFLSDSRGQKEKFSNTNFFWCQCRILQNVQCSTSCWDSKYILQSGQAKNLSLITVDTIKFFQKLKQIEVTKCVRWNTNYMVSEDYLLSELP